MGKTGGAALDQSRVRPGYYRDSHTLPTNALKCRAGQGLACERSGWLIAGAARLITGIRIQEGGHGVAKEGRGMEPLPDFCIGVSEFFIL